MANQSLLTGLDLKQMRTLYNSINMKNIQVVVPKEVKSRLVGKIGKIRIYLDSFNLFPNQEAESNQVLKNIDVLEVSELVSDTISVKIAAEMSNYSENWIRKLCKRKNISAYKEHKEWKIERKSFLNYIRNRNKKLK